MTVEYNIRMNFPTNRLFDHYFRYTFYIGNRNGSPFFRFILKNMAVFNTIEQKLKF